MGQRRAVVLAPVLLIAFLIGANAAAAQTPAPPRVIDLLEATGLNYEKRTPTSWAVRFEGSGGEDIPVVLAQADQILVLVAVAAIGKEMRESVEFQRELLKFNIDADYIKVGLDDDGDYLVRADVRLATLTGEFLKELLDQVATGANQLRPLFAKHKRK